MRTVYPVTPAVVAWLNSTLSPIEQSVFEHYCGIRHLSSVVESAEAGLCVKYAAYSAIQDYNIRNRTCITYGEIRDMCPSYIMSGIGEWVAYTDSYADAKLLVSASDDIMSAMDEVAADVEWLVLWLTGQDVVVVFSSPYVEHLGRFDGGEGLADGESTGPVRAPALPVDVVASSWSLQEIEAQAEWR